MFRTLKIVLIFNLLFGAQGCKGQTDRHKTTLSDDFDKTSPIYYGMPETISSADTSAGWGQNGQKLLLTGTVYKSDGETPASNVLLYYYQTDVNGVYRHLPGEKRSMPPNELGQTHGYIRGWVKTGKDGKYSIRTVRPGSYPSRMEAAHVHITIKEPGSKDHYYIDDFVFDDDRLLTAEKRRKMENRGGSGVLRLVRKGDLHVGERDIILGLNIPDYPDRIGMEVNSGKSVGEDVISFTPYHAWGPDKGTRTCPICKYGWYHGILYFVGNNTDWNEIKNWIHYLESESIRREKYLKVYFVYGNEIGYSRDNRIKKLAQIGQELQLDNVALTFVPSFSDQRSDIYLNEIDQEVNNTFIIYKRSRIIAKFIDLEPTPKNFDLIRKKLDLTVNEYFNLPGLKME